MMFRRRDHRNGTYAAAIRRFVVHDILHADDPPHRLALGIAVGVFVAFTPTFGVQMVLVVVLATLLRANRAVGVPVVWISNPATFVTIYYPCYVLGCKVLAHPRVGRQWWKQLAHPPPGWWESVAYYWHRFMEIAGPLWVGGVLVGLLFAVPTYVIVYWTTRTYRMQRWGQLVPPPKSNSTPAAP